MTSVTIGLPWQRNTFYLGTTFQNHTANVEGFSVVRPSKREKVNFLLFFPHF